MYTKYPIYLVTLTILNLIHPALFCYWLSKIIVQVLHYSYLWHSSICITSLCSKWILLAHFILKSSGSTVYWCNLFLYSWSLMRFWAFLAWTRLTMSIGRLYWEQVFLELFLYSCSLCNLAACKQCSRLVSSRMLLAPMSFPLSETKLCLYCSCDGKENGIYLAPLHLWCLKSKLYVSLSPYI